MTKAPKFWYNPKHPLGYLLWPLSLPYLLIVQLRKLLYRIGILQVTKFKVPIVVVGNISVGGTGKTPLVIWLSNFLQEHGMHPGVVSRGYGSSCDSYPYLVTAHSDAKVVGDEPLLIAKNSGVPVVIAPNRVAAVKRLVAEHQCNIIISDDGLQHYALSRTVEIAVLDGARMLGNGFCLPAGPLREPKSRLRSVDYVVTSSTTQSRSYNTYAAYFEFATPYNLENSSQTKAITEFRGQNVHAVAGIGNPDRFFAMLREQGLILFEHSYPDHHTFAAAELEFTDGLPILMTEKDAIKCQQFANSNIWVVPLTINVPKDLQLTWQQTLCYNPGQHN